MRIVPPRLADITDDALPVSVKTRPLLTNTDGPEGGKEDDGSERREAVVTARNVMTNAGAVESNTPASLSAKETTYFRRFGSIRAREDCYHTYKFTLITLRDRTYHRRKIRDCTRPILDSVVSK